MLKPKVLPLLEECIENGTRRGYNRAHKHVEKPDIEFIVNTIQECVMGEIYEWFDIVDE
jgi:hypothetical protein